MKTASGAQFEISVDGKPRSYRDTKEVAIEPRTISSSVSCIAR